MDKEIYGTEKEWQVIRKSVFERDNYTCQDCGKPGNVAHHKHYRDPKNPDTIVTLCKEHHLKRHGREHYILIGLTPIARVRRHIKQEVKDLVLVIERYMYDIELENKRQEAQNKVFEPAVA